MEEEKYQQKIRIINQISQYNDKINNLLIEFEETGLDTSKNYSKLTKGVSFISYFVVGERKYLKNIRKKFFRKNKNE